MDRTAANYPFKLEVGMPANDKSKPTRVRGHWPEGKQSAACVTFDFDADSVWLAEDPQNERRPVVRSLGAFGAEAVVEHILPLLDRLSAPATFFVPGIVVETYPQVIDSIAAAGHELAAHGYTHRPPASMSPAEEQAELQRSRQALSAHAAEVLGYRSPAWELSPVSLELLARAGFIYSSNMMDSLHPYVHEPAGLVELPVHWVLDDAAHFWFGPGSWNKSMASPSAVLEIWKAEFAGIHSAGGLLVLTLHPQIIGRPHRLSMLERWLEFVQSHPSVWLARGGEVARFVLQASG